jgi:hypothetical protein
LVLQADPTDAAMLGFMDEPLSDVGDVSDVGGWTA